MAAIEILGTGRLDERDSAFPQAVELPGGEILCSFSVGGGPNVTGGTDWARSEDGGRTWTLEGTILPPDRAAGTANFLKLSLSADGRTIFAYGAEIANTPEKPFGQRAARAVLCRSTDGGRSWTAPERVPMPVEGPLEISHAARPLQSGRLLAPAATLPDPARLGERVLVAISDDGGKTWPRHGVVFHDPAGKRGFFEHKLAELPSGQVLATAWTVTLGDYGDEPNRFALSRDGGLTWGPSRSTGICGQTLSTLPLDNDRLLVLYNRRYGRQAVVACLVTFDEQRWTVHHEHVIYDAKARRERPADVESGIDELDAFAFGFPTAIRLEDDSLLVTHWCTQSGVCGIRWTKLRVNE